MTLLRTRSPVAALAFAASAMLACSSGDDAAEGTSSSGDAPPGSTSSSSGGSSSGSSSGSTSGSSGAPDPTHTDGIKNGDETDVDCGGGAAPRCGDGKACGAAADCTSKVCDAANACAVPTKDDGQQNGDESDVDCGGTTTGAPPCAVAKGCNVDEDCASLGCNFEKKCAAGRSCTRKAGGVTCGAGETGTAQAIHEDCCTRIPSAAGPQGPFSVDKYLITAGRMRAFLEKVGGKVRDHIAGNKPAWWSDAWTSYLPNAWDGAGLPAGEHVNIWSAYAQVAGGIIHDAPVNQGCWIGSGAEQSTGHPTFMVPKAAATTLYGDTYDRWLTQDQLDERGLNCTTWVMFAALCAYDGGQIISRAEYDFLADVDGAGAVSKYPWGDTPEAGSSRYGGAIVGPATTAVNQTACPTCDDDRINWFFNYWHPITPAAPANAGNDQSNFISAPGRFPKGGSRQLNADPGSRVQDLLGLFIEMTRTTVANRSFKLTFSNANAADDRTVTLPDMVWRGGSWEGHATGTTWDKGQFTIATKYGKTGTRCVYYEP